MSIIKSVNKWATKESARSGKSKATILANYVQDYLRYGINPKEYYLFHFDGKSPEKKATFFNRKMFRQLLKRNNDPSYVQILNDKYIFSQTYEKFVGRKCIRSGKYMDYADFEAFMENTDKVVFKPNEGSGGVGIQVLKKADFADLREMFEKLKQMPDGVVEQWIRQHEAMTKAYPYAVNCIRIATLYRDGKCHFLGGVFTLGYNKVEIANSLQGALFGLIDMETGIVVTDLCNYSDELYKEHPDTGFVARGFQVPYWKEILELTAKAAAVVPQIGYVGWDVAVGEDGPVLIEGNSLSAGYFAYEHHLLREDEEGSRAVWEPFIN